MNEKLPLPKVDEKAMTVVWSGGFDSTAVILKYLEEGKEVYPVSVSLSNNEDQSTAEKAARLRIFHVLHKEFKDKIHRAREFAWPELFKNGEFGLTQPPIWMYIATMTSPTDEVAFGWVKHDDVWHYRQWIYGLASNFDAFKGRTTNIYFPFEWEMKKDLLRYYVKRENVFDLISTSEAGEDWRLGTDKKCTEMQELQIQLKELIASTKKEEALIKEKTLTLKPKRRKLKK
jgi:hypothetical protein